MPKSKCQEPKAKIQVEEIKIERLTPVFFEETYPYFLRSFLPGMESRWAGAVVGEPCAAIV